MTQGRQDRPHALGIRILQVLQLALQQDIILRDVAKDKSNLGLVIRVVEDLACELEHGSDAGTTSHKGNMGVLVLRQWVLGQWALEVKTLAGLHAVQMLGHRSTLVLLDQQVEESLFI